MQETMHSPLISSPSDFLVVESGSLAGQRFPLPQSPGALLLGRERMCNVRFDPERDRVVGRNHARIEVRGDGIYLIDLNSANGTFRADGRAVRGEVRLSAGERFQLGGEGGPWLSIQTAAAKVAVHVAPPAPDMPTLVTPAFASPFPPARQWPAVPPTPAASIEPNRPLTIVPPKLPLPSPESIAEPEARPLPRRDFEPVRRPDAAPVDPIALQHQKQFHRQIAIIGLLLLLASSVGLAMGLREGPADDDVETPRAD